MIGEHRGVTLPPEQDRRVAVQAVRERVVGRDDGSVEDIPRRQQPSAIEFGDAFSDAHAEFAGRLAGEGEAEHLLGGDLAGADQPHHACRHHRRLARAGSGHDHLRGGRRVNSVLPQPEKKENYYRDIAALIKSVQEEVGNALKSMTAGSARVEEGVKLSNEAGHALTRILDSAAKASDMGKEIANATREQAAGSETVTRAVERLQEMVKQISAATAQQASGSDHILKAVESMREVTKYVRQAMSEQKSGSSMISSAAERMIEMIHEIFQVAANQAAESEKIVFIMEQVRSIADSNRTSASDMSEAISLLNEAIRSLDEEVRKFRVH